MPDNSSGFVDFNAYSDLNRDDETRLMEEAMQRAEAADREAGIAMSKSKQQARGNMDWREGSSTYGQQVGAVEDIAQTASYSDYLAAKKTAESAWAQLAGGTGRAGALRGAIRGGSDMDERAKSGIEASKARGAEGIDWARQNAGGAGQRNAATLAERKRREDEVASREKQSSDDREAYLASLKERMAAAWARMDANHRSQGGAGAFNPFKTGSQGWGGEFNHFGNGALPDGRAMESAGAWGRDNSAEMQKLAQDARAHGLTAEADRFQSTASYDMGGKRTKGGY